MPNPIGSNAGNHGKKGKSGRKTAYEERGQAKMLFEAFFNENDQEELESKIRSGKFSIRDRVKLTAMEGDTKVLNQLSQKVFPDKMEIEQDQKINIDV